MEERISRSKFIRLGAVLGVGTAGASVLAACGGGSGGQSGDGAGGGGTAASGGPETTAAKPSGEPTGNGATEAQGASGGQAADGQALAQTSEVPPGSAVEFEDGGQPALLVHLESGDFVAYSAVCTHRQCTVAYRDGQLACPCHGSVFDPANGGQVVSPPAQRPLPEIPVEVRGGEVYKA